MDIKNTKYYGKPFTVTMIENNEKTWLIATPTMILLMLKRLGFVKSIKILLDWQRKKKELENIDFSALHIRGKNRDKFIEQRLQQTAIFMAMQKNIGLKETIDLHHIFMDKVGMEIQKLYNPPANIFKETADHFKAYSKYIIAEFAAEKEAGLHDYEIVEQTDNTLRINVTYCVFCKIPEMCGMKEACEPGCYSDEVFFPNYLRPLGIAFERTQTLARGGTSCDFKFVKLRNFPL